jgi:hypothetical protein
MRDPKLFAASIYGVITKKPYVKPDKPAFTDEELALVRATPRRERKRVVDALTAKYAKKG